jgi:DNA polymerase-3 subunit beta
MKITIERKELLTALGIVKSAAGDRAQAPILSHVLINTFDKSVEFICTDLNLVLRAKVDAQIKSKGATTVRAGLLHDLARSFTGDQVELEVLADGHQGTLRVICGESRYKLGALPVEEFPPLPRLRDVFELELPQATLRSLLASTSFAAGTDQTGYVLNSNLLRINGNLTAIGCDGCRLALFSAQADGLGKKTRDLILPRPAVAELLRLLNEDEDENKKCRLVTAENLVQFHIGDTVLTTKLIEGAYPNFNEVIPATKGRGTPIGRVDLLNALQRCALISDICQLDFRKQTLTIHAVNNRDIVGEASESLLVPSAETLRLSFTTRHLIEALSAVTDDEVQFFGRPNAAAIIKIDGSPWLSVIMPRGKKEEAKPQTAETRPAKPETSAETRPTNGGTNQPAK